MAARRIPFVKMHGAGNDFVMVDDRAGRFPVDRIRTLANRPDGIGSEGVILLSRSERANFRMRFFNPDGTEAELCGNGARCVAAFARAIGAVQTDVMEFETLAGRLRAEVLSDGRVRIAMPPLGELRCDFACTGVPHRIVPVADLAAVDVAGEGRRIRFAPEHAPNGTNVDFVRFAPPHALSLRTYERGVEAESGACGTGAVAAVVVGVAQYGLAFPVKVTTRGGYELEVGGEYDGGVFSSLTLTGPVRRVFEGVIEL